MAGDIDSLKERLGQADFRDGSFSLLADIAEMVSNEGRTAETIDLVIRALDRADQFSGEKGFLLALARDHGLFPYILDLEGRPSSAELALRDAIAMEMHRPEGLEDVVFHSVQAQVYQRLLNRENVILSAPTSFGKSLIVDSLIATDNYQNIVIIVPTIALMDETRRRLSRFGNYKIITHPGQSFEAKNLFVLTQERYFALEGTPPVDLFFIDEFYKLSDEGSNDTLTGRSALLNQALRRLLGTGAQFYLAGPTIRALDHLLPANITAAFIRTDYATVAADTIHLSGANDDQRRAEIERVLSETTEPTLIYCQSPKRVREVMKWLTDSASNRQYGPGMSLAADWISANYSPQWSLPNGLRRGIGAHHGRLPRWLAQAVVEGFNNGDLGVLVCTNSLIEGVNTRAKSIIILDKKIANSAYDYFTFANIRGRAGRMLKHFIGKIYLFHPEPDGPLPDIDIPGITQSDAAPSSLLLSIQEDQRTERTRERLKTITEQSTLSQAMLIQNLGVEPEAQIELAEYLFTAPKETLASYQWDSAYPKYEQLKAAIKLIWDFIPPDNSRNHGARSSDQLTLFVNKVATADGDIKAVIDIFTENPDRWGAGESADDRIETAFDFLRFWVDHNLPALLRALDGIVKEVLPRRGMAPGNFLGYAARVESGFLPPMLMSLEEFGIPVQVSRKLSYRLPRYDTLDELIANLKNMDPDLLTRLDRFEEGLVIRALQTM
ncbi:DEAD/DEAH box helicase [Lacisediminihabitans sp.]|uniref:DEAD/DEAH box helicase n=1 Tax=Lacisediminihabitans sp. TaxID=2787631 RepID=UPI00374CFD28